MNDGVSFIGGLLLLLTILLVAYSCAVLASGTVLWEGDKWECTNIVYPSPEKKEMFTPYCTQYSMESR